MQKSRFRKRHTEIVEAYQWWPDMDSCSDVESVEIHGNTWFFVKDIDIMVNPGDWIVNDENGCLSVYNPVLFEAKYQQI